MRVKQTLPDLPTAMMDILVIIHDFIFNKTNSGKSIDDDSSPEELGDDNFDRPRLKKKILMADDLPTKQFHSSMLEYHVLLLLHKLLYYSTSYSRQNSKSKVHKIIAKMILRRFKFIMKVLKSKHSSLKSKTLCMKIINILLATHSNQMTKLLVQV